MENDVILKIKDSVDLFLTEDSLLTVYYMNTRIRKSFKVNPLTVKLLESIDGMSSISDLAKSINLDIVEVRSLIQAFLSHKIITPIYSDTSFEDSSRYTRQINYFSEFYETEEMAYSAQKQLKNYNILVLGCGAVGGAIAVQLAMAGVQHFTLFDDDIVIESDISRHIYFQERYIGKKKTEALESFLKQIDNRISVNCINKYLEPKTNIEEMVSDADFIINTLDEPYIGYTAAKIYRICVKYKKPHYIAGGFDAHLASTGELIIPGITPCVECYATYFKEKLKGWKPKKHPVISRSEELGGLSSLSLFSASYASMESVKYLLSLVDMGKEYKIRGEFLFDSMELTYLDVQKNDLCPVCGALKDE